jgi:YD repeat-containing protein
MTLAQAYRKQFGKVLYPFRVYDSNGNRTYSEYSNGYWCKSEYDADGNETYHETSNGYWTKYAKYKYDADGNETHYENSDGFWSKREYDAKGNVTYYEDSNRYWRKREYDSNGNETYYENSSGTIRGSKQNQSCEGKVVEIDGKKYSAEQVRERIAELKPVQDK